MKIIKASWIFCKQVAHMNVFDRCAMILQGFPHRQGVGSFIRHWEFCP
jgi:hypothetical protein